MVAARATSFARRGRNHSLSAGLARESFDLVIVGGGPAGLATAIVAARQGLSAMVLERGQFPPDKACGEGILPPGVWALEQLGILNCLDPSELYPFAGIRFIQEDGSSVEFTLPLPGGLGIRRTVLIEALTRRAEQLGAVIRHRCGVSRVRSSPGQSIVRSSAGNIAAHLVVAADGLHSPLRRAAGLEVASRLPRRFALRQHYNVAPWTDRVEVYVDDKGEAVATPVCSDTVTVNFTWTDGLIARPNITSLACRFPALQARLKGAASMTPVRGAGPMARIATRCTSDRLVLVGDAAGFVDSISGDGLSVAFNSALTLGRHLPEVLAQRATRKSLEAYERAARRLFRGYWIVTNGLLWLARHPRTRKATIRYLSRNRWLLDAVVNLAMTKMTMAD